VTKDKLNSRYVSGRKFLGDTEGGAKGIRGSASNFP